MRGAGAARIAAPLALWLAAVGAAPPDAPPASYTRQQMESWLPVPRAWRFVYGTRDPATSPTLRARALGVARGLFGLDSSQVMADSAVSETAIAAGPLVLIGGPRENAWTSRWAPRLPVRFSGSGFQFFGTTYDRPGDAIHLVWPHPLDPRQFLLLVAANSPGALAHRGGGFYFGGSDYRIFRDGELARSGRFAQGGDSAWTYDPALDRDREGERRRYARGLVETHSAAIVVLSPPDLAGSGMAARVRARADEIAARWGMPRAPVRVSLYASLEQKGALTRDTRPESVLRDSGTATVGVRAGVVTPDLWSWGAASIARDCPGAAPEWLEAAGVWMAGAYDGEPLEVAVARTWFGGLWLDPASAAGRVAMWRSPRRLIPSRAVLCGALWRMGGRPGLVRALRGGATLDSMAVAARVSRAGLAALSRNLADSLARAGLVRERASGTRSGGDAAIRFARGVCFTHSVDLERGYLSSLGGQSLRELRALGADAVSLSCFAYLPSLTSFELFPTNDGGPDEETDEAVAEAAMRAHDLGMQVQLKPHLWARGWAGDLRPAGPTGWDEFFTRYREYLLHCALFAQRYGIESLSVGHELKTATMGHDREWRALIAAVRGVYRGRLTYGANWDEVEQVGFWDALDEIGVSFYYPLADKPTRDPSTLRAGAQRALASLEATARRFKKPALLGEAGYPSLTTAPLRPWDETPGPADPEMQQLCDQALVQALEGKGFVSGVYWWKWFSDPEAGGLTDASYTPQGKPARGTVESAFRKWRDRPIKIPG
jgi:hypothetical protein